MNYIQVIYPDEYVIDERKARMWASDAIANGEADSDWDNLDVDKAPIEDIIHLLNDTGNVTYYIKEEIYV